MNRVFVAVAAVVVIFAMGCIKSADPTASGVTACTNIPPSLEQSQIQAFLHTDSIPFKEDSSGVYYHIFTPGQGLAASAYSTLFFSYTATSLSDSVFASSSTSIQLAVSNSILGIQLMANYFKKGMHIQLIIPSALAYGCQGAYNGNTVIVPSNTIVLYDLNITDVQ